MPLKINATQERYDFWQSDTSAYDDAWTMDDAYSAYQCYSLEGKAKIDEICEKYGLKLLGEGNSACSVQEILYALDIRHLVSTSTVADTQLHGGGFYPGGSFWMLGEITLPQGDGLWPHPIEFRFRYVMKDVFDNTYLNVGDIQDYDQWQYTLEDHLDEEYKRVTEQLAAEIANACRMRTCWDGNTYTNSYAGFGCQLDEDWVYQGAEEDGKRLSQTVDMLAENAKELATIRVLYTQLDFKERLTYRMLSQEEILDTLLTEQDAFAQRYTQQGTEVSSIEKLPVQFLGQEHFALKTETVTDGIPCYTVQIMDYTAGEYGVTLSVSSYLEDKTQQLLDLFYVVE